MKTIYEFLLKNKTSVSTQNKFVDLGLPSGLLWATCNIGANDPTEYGDYFMWGSTEPNTNDVCDWEHTPFNNGSNDYDEQYFNSVKDSVCPYDFLMPEYDAASIIMGDRWRLPCKEDFWELRMFTKHEWVTNYLGRGVDGMLFTSKTNDDDTIFIPASGSLSKHTVEYKENYIFLWATTINTSSPKFAYSFIAHSNGINILSNKRYYGFCLRGVQENI